MGDSVRLSDKLTLREIVFEGVGGGVRVIEKLALPVLDQVRSSEKDNDNVALNVDVCVRVGVVVLEGVGVGCVGDNVKVMVCDAVCDVVFVGEPADFVLE